METGGGCLSVQHFLMLIDCPALLKSLSLSSNLGIRLRLRKRLRQRLRDKFKAETKGEAEEVFLPNRKICPTSFP